jgi:hypothetical protein
MSSQVVALKCACGIWFRPRKRHGKRDTCCSRACRFRELREAKP